MKFYLFSIIFLVSVFGNDLSNSEVSLDQESENFEWILGVWIRTIVREDVTTTETWKRSPDNIYIGKGLSVKNKETIFRENIRLLEKNGNWVYEVTGVNKDTTNFVISSFSENSFTSENPENEFPKKVTYKKENGLLVAEISGGDKKIIFEFKSTSQK